MSDHEFRFLDQDGDPMDLMVEFHRRTSRTSRRALTADMIEAIRAAPEKVRREVLEPFGKVSAATAADALERLEEVEKDLRAALLRAEQAEYELGVARSLLEAEPAESVPGAVRKLRLERDALRVRVGELEARGRTENPEQKEEQIREGLRALLKLFGSKR